MSLAVYDAFGEKLNTFAANISPAIPVAYIGSPVEFEPPSVGEWLEAAVFWNGTENYALGVSGHVETGFFRVGVVTRAGIQAAQPIAELLVAEFPKMTSLATAIVFKSPDLSGPLQETDRLTIPVTISWRLSR